MTMEELEDVFGEGCPVECKDIVYKCVSAIIRRKLNGKEYVQAELLDKGGNSVTIENPASVRRVQLTDVECPF